MHVTRKAVLLAAMISVMSGAICTSSARAQRPEVSSAVSLLSRECSSRYMKTFEQPLTVAIGREIFNPTFYLSSWYDNEAGHLTCSLSSSTSGAAYPSHVRLQFGLSDRAASGARASVTAYVDGQLWGTEILSPKMASRVWFVEVDSARNISIEVECLEACSNWDSSGAAQKVYFARAELEFNPISGSSYGYPSEPIQQTYSDSTSDTQTPVQQTQSIERSRRPTNPPQQSGNSGNLGDSIRSIGDSIREINGIIDIFR